MNFIKLALCVIIATHYSEPIVATVSLTQVLFEQSAKPQSGCEKKFEIPKFLGLPITGNYFKAIQVCHLLGMQVVTPDTEDKDQAVIKFMRKNGIMDTWTSANDLGNKGSYNWLFTGELLNYNNWAPNQPDNVENIEDCVQIWYRNTQYNWNDIPCTASLNIVCESKLENC